MFFDLCTTVNSKTLLFRLPRHGVESDRDFPNRFVLCGEKWRETAQKVLVKESCKKPDPNTQVRPMIIYFCKKVSNTSWKVTVFTAGGWGGGGLRVAPKSTLL